MAARRDVEKLAQKIAVDFQPERIVLFGSHASDKPRPDSDVDLLVILRHKGKPWDAAARIRSRIKAPFPLDLLVRSPRQIESRLALGDPFLTEIMRTGKVLYEAHHG